MNATYIVILAASAGLAGITLGVAPSVIAWGRRRRQMRASR